MYEKKIERNSAMIKRTLSSCTPVTFTSSDNFSQCCFSSFIQNSEVQHMLLAYTYIYTIDYNLIYIHVYISVHIFLYCFENSTIYFVYTVRITSLPHNYWLKYMIPYYPNHSNDITSLTRIYSIQTMKCTGVKSLSIKVRIFCLNQNGCY